ncbi:melatonin receptor type 1B-like [Asterias rubens]|uniref:melatonin receptor type 1B-like n=1 Tax=Asterias rubens TaxID=7604 RepID=UPI0014558348|nr:melatonin receptor type 1B-like [Asterias rubens]
MEDNTTMNGFSNIVRVFHCTGTVLAVLLGIIGNFLVIVAIATTPKLRTSHNVLLVNLSLVDLLLSLFFVSAYSIGVIAEGWPLSQAACRYTVQFSLVLGQVSLITLVVVATNRYLLIAKPADMYHRYCGLNKIVLIIVFMWLQSFAVFLIAEFILKIDIRYQSEFATCALNPRDTISHQYIAVVICCMVLTVLIVMPLQYIRTFLAVRSSKRRVQPALGPRPSDLEMRLGPRPPDQEMRVGPRPSVEVRRSMGRPTLQVRIRSCDALAISKEEIRIIKMSILLTLVYVLSYTPISTIYMFGVYYPILFRGGSLGIFILTIVPAINPFVYAWMNKNIREALYRVVRSCKRQRLRAVPAGQLLI